MDHKHTQSEKNSDHRLLIAFGLNIALTLTEIIGGLIAGSLSLISDAVHNGSDAASIGISYGAQKVARRKPDRQRTFGYNRAEIIAALINLTTLFVIALFLLWQAINRFFNPQPVDGVLMLIVGAIAFVEDAISAYLLYKGSKESLNVRSAFIHLLSDTLATLGVVIGGLLVMLYNIYIVDPIITALIAVYIMIHGYIEIRKVIYILMESAPKDFDFQGMLTAVEDIEEVQDFHHIHVWRLDESRSALEAHVSINRDDLNSMEHIKSEIKHLLSQQFNVKHTTLEFELDGGTRHDRTIIQE